MSREIVRDYNEKDDEKVVKKLGSPIKRSVLTGNTRAVSSDDDFSSLNTEGSEDKGRPSSSRESQKRTILGNTGPDSQGKMDFSKNPDSVDYILQTHESYGNADTDEGYLDTGEKCYRQFNKLFSTKTVTCKVTAEEISGVLKKFNTSNPSKKITKPTSGTPSKITPERQEVVVETSTYFQIPLNKSLKVLKDVMPLYGEHFEICKILGCKHICLTQKSSGAINQNNAFFAGCANSEGSILKPGCPQEEPFGPKEQMVFELFKNQFQGDELKAKKLVYMTKSLK